ncbi:hypothetical protein [Blastococcus sp. TF02A_35]|nr:hypothetical protein [Blastococcus sp. TF02A_35]
MGIVTGRTRDAAPCGATGEIFTEVVPRPGVSDRAVRFDAS